MGCLNICVTDLTHRLNSVDIYAKDITKRLNVCISMMCTISINYEPFETEDGYLLTKEGFRFLVLKNKL